MRPSVVFDVSANLFPPELLPRRRPFKEMAVVPVPETSIDVDCRPVARQNEVRLAGQFLRMEQVAKPRSMQRFTDLQLWLGMAGSDRSHIPASGRGIVNVGQNQATRRRSPVPTKAWICGCMILATSWFFG